MKRTITKLLLALGFLASSTASSRELDAELLRHWQWRLLGPSTPAGRAWTVVGVESAPKTLYVTTASGGVWKSVNAGTTFEPIFDDASVASTSVVAVAPSNSDIVWVATGEPANTRANSWGDGVYKSENGGESFSHAGLSETRMIGHLIIHPENSDIVYVAAMGRLWGRNEQRGIFRTSNGGRSWDKVLFIDDTTGFNDIQMDPQNPDVLYAGAWQRFRYGGGDMVESGAGSGLYKSTDGGDTWIVLSNGLPTDPMGKIHIAIARGNPRLVYANILTGEAVRPPRTSSQGGLFRSGTRGRPGFVSTIGKRVTTTIASTLIRTMTRPCGCRCSSSTYLGMADARSKKSTCATCTMTSIRCGSIPRTRTISSYPATAA